MGIICSSAHGSSLWLSVTGHTGSPREHWVDVWALAEVRDMCSGGLKSLKLVNNHGIAFRPARTNQAHVNPKKQLDFHHT